MPSPLKDIETGETEVIKDDKTIGVITYFQSVVESKIVKDYQVKDYQIKNK